jgi:tripartite-type tricarboxylate transporter receptor subunit TctC
VKRLSDMNRREAALALLAAGLPFGAAQAQTYPSRPIKLIVPVPPGSGVDAVSRSLGAQMSEAMGVPIVTEYKPGASAVAARSSPSWSRCPNSQRTAPP